MARSSRSDYRIREVDASDEEIAEIIHEFNKTENQWPRLTDDELDGSNCFWWFAYLGTDPVAFAGVVPSRLYQNTGYLKRSYVMPSHRGHGLQRRFFRIREKKARVIGWTALVSETTDALHSANNFIRAGYRLFEPKEPWAFERSLYWKKEL